MKKCTRCQERKMLDQFSEDSTRCIECQEQKEKFKKVKRKQRENKTEDYNNMEFVVGLLVGEFTGFNF